MHYIVIFALFFSTILFPAHELSSTQKLLLREKVGANVYAWDDHDSKTIAALFLVDKDLNKSIHLIKKFPQFPLAQSAIVCNRFCEWCAFKRDKDQSRCEKRIDIFFGNQTHAQSYCLSNTMFKLFNIEPITYDTEGSFCVHLKQDMFDFVLISPERKRVWHVWDKSDESLEYFLETRDMTEEYLKRILPYLAGSVFKKLNKDVFSYRVGIHASVQDVRSVFHSRDFVIEQLFFPCNLSKLLALQSENPECVCAPECIDDRCKSRYKALVAIFGSYVMAREFNYEKAHCFRPIDMYLKTDVKKDVKFFVNPFGHIVISDTVSKFSANVGTIDILKPVNWETFNLSERAAWYAKQCFIVGDVLCYRGSDTNYLKILCARKNSGGFLEATVYKIIFPRDDVTIVDGVE